MKLAPTSHWDASVENDIPSARVSGVWVGHSLFGSLLVPFSGKGSIKIALIASGRIRADDIALILSRKEIAPNYSDGMSMQLLGIAEKSGALMDKVAKIIMIAFINIVELANYRPVVKVVVKVLSAQIGLNNIGRESRRRGSLGGLVETEVS